VGFATTRPKVLRTQVSLSVKSYGIDAMNCLCYELSLAMNCRCYELSAMNCRAMNCLAMNGRRFENVQVQFGKFERSHNLILAADISQLQLSLREISSSSLQFELHGLDLSCAFTDSVHRPSN